MATVSNVVPQRLNEENRTKPRKIRKIKPSKYENLESVEANRQYWQGVLETIDINEPTIDYESKQMSKVLPRELYEKVCSTLGLPVIPPETTEDKPESERPPRRMVKDPLLSYKKTLHIDREMDSDTDVEYCPSDEDEELPDVYREMMQKPIREVVTWPTRYLLPEKEDQKSLVKKADDLTDRIAQEFCEYMRQLGGNQQSQLFTPKAIKELFQIEFDYHVARSLKILPKELPAVPESVANAANTPEHSYQAALNREISKDIRAEQIPDKVMAFGTELPWKEQWHAPRNETKQMWRTARRVPRDLVTLKTVWEGITNLRSVKEYCRWMIDHPTYRRAPYLCSLGMFDPAVLDARLSYELKMDAAPRPLPASADNTPAPIADLRKRLSELAE